MGNQLVGIAPSQIFPVEHYLTEHSDLQFDVNLGSTRFFKVARAKSQEGLIVVKVFAIHDPSLPLSSHKSRVDQIRSSLASAVNCLPFQRSVLSDKAGFLMREYVKFNLYDRISTRPFLSNVEKKWIAFQLLYALHQCHKVGVCHGDIKLENVGVTSWHWVLLTDFASFKPVHLPEDNPADFSYFFDTSRRRTCYVAPERFVKTLGSETTQLILPEDNLKKGDLTPAMDMFSAGCVLAELFSDGHPPFDFSQLLAYRSGEYNFDNYLNRIEDVHVRNLIKDMVQMDPGARLSAEVYLSQERGRLFPEYFYSFLHSYMLIFSGTSPIFSPDEKMERLRKDVFNVIGLLKTEEEKYHASREGDKPRSNGCEALILITSLVTSCIRGMHFSNSKLQCLEILQELSANTSSETVLDRILPYIMYLVHDPFPRVRVAAIHTLTKALSHVKTVPPSDTNVFPEYILPGLAAVAHDEAVIVRTAFAENVAELAEISLRLLEHWQVSAQETPKRSYETELAALHDMMQEMVAALLTDPHNVVKQTLIENGITKLCVFFGKQKSNDLLLSHMITFLNDKEDKYLRGSFFDCIIGVAAYIGTHSSPIVSPLLQQGLTDSEEFVARKAINTITALTELSLLHKCALYQLLEESACLLCHPNLWIRQAVVGFISALARSLNMVDVQCKVMVVIGPYLRCPVIQLEKEVLILNSLKPPVPRTVLDSVLRAAEFQQLLQALIDRQKARRAKATSLVLPTVTPSSPHQSNAIKNLFRRLVSDGMTEDVEDQLLLMAKYLLKVHRHSAFDTSKPVIGKLDLGMLRNPVQCHIAVMSKADPAKDGARRGDEYLAPSMVEEWKQVFGSVEGGLSRPERGSPGGGASWEGAHSSSSTQHSLDIDCGVPEKSFIQYRCAPCRLELRDLLRHRESLHGQLVGGREWGGRGGPGAGAGRLGAGWRLRPALVAHLHGHSGAVTRLVALPHLPLLASAGADGCVRLWDCGRVEGKNVANRARQLYNSHAGPLVGLVLCNNNSCLAAASASGSIIVLKLDSNSHKMSVLDTRQQELEEEGAPVDVALLDWGQQSVLAYATVYGHVVGWDLRAPGPAWRLDNDLRQGVITAMHLDSRQCVLSLGTSSGHYTCWDLRFHLPISRMAHPTGARVRRIAAHPTQPSWIVSSVVGNNEVSLWDIESGSRQAVIWGSNAPPLSNTQQNSHSVCALYPGMVDKTPFLLTGGSDHRVRFWDLDNLGNSYLAIPAGSDLPGQVQYSYKCRLIDGTNVVQELQSKVSGRGGVGGGGTAGGGGGGGGGPPVGTVEEAPRAGPEQPPTGHHNVITDLAMCHYSQPFLVTAASDGVIKVWK